MATVKITYSGNLRTTCTHEKSGTQLITDAPVDNKGKGESFSPTDLIAAAYVSCMMTIIGIYCQEHDLNFKHGEGTVEKIMASGPRRISALQIELDLSNNEWTEKECLKIERAAKTCPVALSVSSDMEINLTFKF
jgi:uncharacterized OsmC-like protein